MDDDYILKKGDAILIAELAKGTSKSEAARLAGVHMSTVANRQKDIHFRRLVSEHRRVFLDATAGMLAKASFRAAEVLYELCDDEDAPEHVRRSAARDVLDHAMKLREFGELEERILNLEEMLEREVAYG